jgi:hypothetical protein
MGGNHALVGHANMGVAKQGQQPAALQVDSSTTSITKTQMYGQAGMKLCQITEA